MALRAERTAVDPLKTMLSVKESVGVVPLWAGGISFNNVSCGMRREDRNGCVSDLDGDNIVVR